MCQCRTNSHKVKGTLLGSKIAPGLLVLSGYGLLTQRKTVKYDRFSSPFPFPFFNSPRLCFACRRELPEKVVSYFDTFFTSLLSWPFPFFPCLRPNWTFIISFVSAGLFVSTVWASLLCRLWHVHSRLSSQLPWLHRGPTRGGLGAYVTVFNVTWFVTTGRTLFAGNSVWSM